MTEGLNAVKRQALPTYLGRPRCGRRGLIGETGSIVLLGHGQWHLYIIRSTHGKREDVLYKLIF